MRVTILILILFGSLYSCSFEQKENKKPSQPSILTSKLRERYIDTIPDNNKLIGKWNVTKKSKRLIQNFSKRYPSWDAWTFTFEKIELLENGKVNAWVNSPPLPPIDTVLNKFVNNGIITGEWKVLEYAVSDYYFSGSLDSYSINFTFGMPEMYYGRQLYIALINDELILWTYVQDPDSQEYQEFKKIK